jgi:phosphoribosylglycinamide formyltransferase-1
MATFMSKNRKVVSFLASHGGTAVKHVIAAIDSGELIAECGIVITNNRDSEIYRWCLENGIRVVHISGNTHPDEARKDEAIAASLSEVGTSIIVLSGYMKKIGTNTLEEYSSRILNIHPSLLPRHGGKGLYGDRVHESVIRSGDNISGATVHFINEEYDEGPVIAQLEVKVESNETVESLKKKVQAIEGSLYIEAISKIV